MDPKRSGITFEDIKVKCHKTITMKPWTICICILRYVTRFKLNFTWYSSQSHTAHTHTHTNTHIYVFTNAHLHSHIIVSFYHATFIK